MIELYNVIISSFMIFLLFNGNLIFYKDLKINIFKKMIFSIIIFLNIFLVFSFFSNGMIILFCSIIVIILVNFFNFVKNIKNFYFLYFILFNLVMFTQITIEPILGWDGQAIWYPKAYNYFSGGSFDSLNEFTRSDYPHLGSYVWAFFWKYSLLKYEYVGRYVQIFIYLSSLFSDVRSEPGGAGCEHFPVPFGPPPPPLQPFSPVPKTAPPKSPSQLSQ